MTAAESVLLQAERLRYVPHPLMHMLRQQLIGKHTVSTTPAV